MIDELTELNNQYGKNHTFVDEEFIGDVVGTYASKHKIFDELNGVIIKDKGPTFYSSITGNITFNPTTVHHKTFKELLTPEEYIYLYNLRSTFRLLHELDHVRQERVINNDPLTMEKKLLILNDNRIFIPNGSEKNKLEVIRKIIHSFQYYHFYYNKNHDRAPSERIANLVALSMVQEVLSRLDEQDNRGIKCYTVFTNNQMIKQMLNGYTLIGDMTNSPSIDYLEGMKHTRNKEMIANDNSFKENDLSTKERLLYGLYLTKEEFTELEESVKTR